MKFDVFMCIWLLILSDEFMLFDIAETQLRVFDCTHIEPTAFDVLQYVESSIVSKLSTSI